MKPLNKRKGCTRKVELVCPEDFAFSGEKQQIIQCRINKKISEFLEF